jgi:hypothetical protein
MNARPNSQGSGVSVTQVTITQVVLNAMRQRALDKIEKDSDDPYVTLWNGQHAPTQKT